MTTLPRWDWSAAPASRVSASATSASAGSSRSGGVLVDLCTMSSGLLKALRSDSYVELSQYRDQHFRVRRAGPREGKALAQNPATWFSPVSLSSPILWFPETQSEAPVPAGEWMPRAWGCHRIPFSHRKGMGGSLSHSPEAAPGAWPSAEAFERR